MKYVLVKTVQGTRGKLSKVRAISIEHFIYGNEKIDRSTQIAEVGGGWSLPLREMTVEMFERVFAPEAIGDMERRGLLDYYPNGNRHKYWDGTISTYIFTDVETKYPIFSAKVYKKYGVEKSPQEISE